MTKKTHKICGGGNVFCPNYFDNFPSHDLASFHGDAKISLKFYVKTFFLVFIFFLIVNKAEMIDFPDKLLKTRK